MSYQGYCKQGANSESNIANVQWSKMDENVEGRNLKEKCNLPYWLRWTEKDESKVHCTEVWRSRSWSDLMSLRFMTLNGQGYFRID